MTRSSRIHSLTALGMALAAAGLCAPAQAQDSYSYFGLGVGQSRVHVDDARIAQTLLGSGLTTTAVAHDDRDTAYKVFGGYQFNRWVGMELGFFKLGTFDFQAQTVPAGSLNGTFRVQGANLDVVGTLPITDQLSALARVGAQYARTRTTITSTGAVNVTNPRPSDREVNPKVGLGLQYAFSRNLMMRAEIERFKISDAVGNHPQVNMVSVSLVVPFGRSDSSSRRTSAAPSYQQPPVVASPAPVFAAPAPAVVAQAPMPPMAVAPQTRRVSYSAESFFAFDRSELRPEGKAALDAFAADLGATRYDTITVQGHADRIGSTAYNQTLSLERAEAVKAYLVNTARLDGSRISATGRSEGEPVTEPEQCKGAGGAAVIACLQPDRRVMIEVAGTR